MATRKSTTKRKTAAKRARGGAKKSTAKRASTRARSGAAAGGAGGGGASRSTRAPATPATPARQARAIQRTTRQSPYKMRLVIDEIRGKDVNAALNYLAFSKKHAAKQIEKVLRSAVAHAGTAPRVGKQSLGGRPPLLEQAVAKESSELQ